MNDAEKNKATADKNLARQAEAKNSPKRNEPGFVYNDDGAEIQNPGPTSGPYYSEDKPIGYPQLGDRVMSDATAEQKASNTPAENPGDKQGGEPLTPSEPGSASVQKVDPLDHDGDGKKGGSKPKGK